MKYEGLLSLSAIERGMGPHDGFLKREMEIRKEALECVSDLDGVARYIGGQIELVENGDWVIRKEVFPGITIHFTYEHSDEEFPSSLRAFYSGEKAKTIPGEDLVHLTVACANHMLRYVREICGGEGLPEICCKV